MAKEYVVRVAEFWMLHVKLGMDGVASFRAGRVLDFWFRLGVA